MTKSVEILDKTPQQPVVASRPRGRAVLWLLFLGPFFFLTYGFANQLATQQADVATIVFDWERHIPFIPWTIIPYWIIDIMYGISLFICASRMELNRHALRLLTAQTIAVSCFILFPLGFSFERPATDGVYGGLFTALSQFDQPYNQAPSLHITLLVILWVIYARHLPKVLIWPCHLLCSLIAVSVLTTYQHHFVDVPTGALLGWLCVWLWPLEGESMLATGKLTHDPRRWRIASYYMLGASAFAGLAVIYSGWALWLFWPALSLLLVALNYLYFGQAGFQKGTDGKLSMASRWLLFPYLLGARINSRWWTRALPKAVEIKDSVYLGRFPSRQDISYAPYQAIIDVTAEFNKPNMAITWETLPQLDLLAPSHEQLLHAASLIGERQAQGPVLVACALGYSRSALAIMAWLIKSGRVQCIDEAIEAVRVVRPTIVVSEQARQKLAVLAITMK